MNSSSRLLAKCLVKFRKPWRSRTRNWQRAREFRLRGRTRQKCPSVCVPCKTHRICPHRRNNRCPWRSSDWTVRAHPCTETICFHDKQDCALVARYIWSTHFDEEDFLFPVCFATFRLRTASNHQATAVMSCFAFSPHHIGFFVCCAGHISLISTRFGSHTKVLQSFIIRGDFPAKALQPEQSEEKMRRWVSPNTVKYLLGVGRRQKMFLNNFRKQSSVLKPGKTFAFVYRVWCMLQNGLYSENPIWQIAILSLKYLQ